MTNTNTQPTPAELKAMQQRIAELEAQLAAKNSRTQTLSLKVSEKGAVSAYGVGRFPVTLYMSQWEFLLGHAEEIKTFIKANVEKLAVKNSNSASK